MPSAAIVFPHVFDISGVDDATFILQGEEVTGISTDYTLECNMDIANWNTAFHFKEGAPDASEVDVTLGTGWSAAFDAMMGAAKATIDGSLVTLDEAITNRIAARAGDLLEVAATELEGGDVSYAKTYSDAILKGKISDLVDVSYGKACLQSIYEQVLSADPSRNGIHNVEEADIPFLSGDSLEFVVKIKYGKIQVEVSSLAFRNSALKGMLEAQGFAVTPKNPLDTFVQDQPADEKKYKLKVNMKTTAELAALNLVPQ